MYCVFCHDRKYFLLTQVLYYLIRCANVNYSFLHLFFIETNGKNKVTQTTHEKYFPYVITENFLHISLKWPITTQLLIVALPLTLQFLCCWSLTWRLNLYFKCAIRLIFKKIDFGNFFFKLLFKKFMITISSQQHPCGFFQWINDINIISSWNKIILFW